MTVMIPCKKTFKRPAVQSGYVFIQHAGNTHKVLWMLSAPLHWLSRHVYNYVFMLSW